MADYRYLVVPFIGQIKAGQPATEVGKQLQAVIDKHVEEGWEFHQLADVNIQVQPGCLAAFFGAKASYITYDQLIFRRSGS